MCILGVVLALAVRYFAVDKKYTYSSSYYITNHRLARISIDVGSLETDIQVANSCEYLLKSEDVLNTLSEMLLEKYGEEFLSNYFTLENIDGETVINQEELDKCIKVSSVTEGVAVLNIEITTKNQYLSLDMGNFLDFLAPNVVYYYVGMDYMSPFDNARLDDYYEFFGLKKTLAVGIFLGFAAAVIIILIYDKMNENVIFDRDDIKNRFGLTILGFIPYYDFDKDRQGRKRSNEQFE
ncbi:MAG: hypothetical protein LUD81_08110 [Clostridiales bacterium]|nr:hypothetical protein [Clostridiales bacterium]